MLQHREIRILPHSPDKMFDLVADIERYPEFLPWCKDAEIVSRVKGKVVADLVIGYKIFEEKFTSEVQFKRPRSITVNYRSGPLSHLSNVWEFRPAANGGCEVLFEVGFDFKSPFLRAAMTLFFDKALARLSSAFEDRARAVYGQSV